MVTGLVILCICQTKVRYIGGLLITLGVVHLTQEEPPKILLSHSGKLSALYEKGDLMVSSRANKRHLQTVWKEAVGTENILKLNEEDICK